MSAPQTALIKTAAGALYKVNASALQGKTVGQQIIIKTCGSGSTTTTATIVSINPATPAAAATNKAVTSVATSNANVSTAASPGVVIRSIAASNASPATPGQRIQIIRPVTPVTMTTNSTMTPVMASPLTSQIRLTVPTPSTPNNIVVTGSSASATSTPVSTTATTPLQHFVQIPIRLPDGRTQTINLPVSLIQGNQPVQIALNQTAGGPIITVRPRFAPPVTTTATLPPAQPTGPLVVAPSPLSTVSTTISTPAHVTTASHLTTAVNVVTTNATAKIATLPTAAAAATATAASSNAIAPSTIKSPCNTSTTATSNSPSAGAVTVKSERNGVSQVKREHSESKSSPANNEVASTGPPAKKLKLSKTANENLSQEVCSLKKEIKEKQVLLEKQLFKDAQYSLDHHKASKVSNNNHSLSHVTDYGDCKMQVDESKSSREAEQVDNVHEQHPQEVDHQEDVVSSNNSTNDHKATKQSEELYCICRQPYDETQFYVGCDECEGWFHGSCVNVTPSQAATIDKYFCPSCEKK